MTQQVSTRDERFRAWRKLSFGNDEAWRRADMADIDPPQERTVSDLAAIWRAMALVVTVTALALWLVT